jgi:putative nucleotidyltransferase with HDIG domain
MEKELRILHLEDNPLDAELVESELKNSGLDFSILLVASKDEYKEALEEAAPDVILSDYLLPDFDGVSALAWAVEMHPDVPFIYVSGAIDEELAIKAIKSGAADYVYKNRLSKLSSAIPRALAETREKAERRLAEERLRAAFDWIRKQQTETIAALASVTVIRDPYTAGHQQRVASLACAIAEEMGLPADTVDGIRVAGILHDIGKIAVPAEILTKPGKLSELEFGVVKTHAETSYEILKEIEFQWPVAEIVYQHHERCDGSGYPRGLKGDEILLEVRILSVADVVEAMSSHRPYRPALELEAALEEVERGCGTLYDPEVCGACLRLFHERGYVLETAT